MMQEEEDALLSLLNQLARRRRWVGESMVRDLLELQWVRDLLELQWVQDR